MLDKTYRLGVCSWEDAQTTRREDLPEKCPLMQSIGYIKLFPNRVIVVSLLPPDGDISNGIATTIPKGCVQMIRWLK